MHRANQPQLPFVPSIRKAFIFVFILWIMPFVARFLINDFRYTFLIIDLSVLALGVWGIGHIELSKKFALVYWLIICLAIICIAVLLSPGALLGTALCIITLLSLGFASDRIFLLETQISKVSRECIFLRIPYILGLGTFSLIIICCLAGSIVDILYIFRFIPYLSLLCAIWCFFKVKGKEINDVSLNISLGPDEKGLIFFAIVLPLILVFHKFLHFYYFGGSGHAEMVVPIINSIAVHSNFPVRFPGDQEIAKQIIPPIDGHNFSPAAIGARFSEVAGALFPGHYGGEILAAFFQSSSGIHPYNAFRVTQLFTSFIIFGWSTVMLAPLLKNLYFSIFLVLIMVFHLNDNHYIDRDLEVMALLGSYYLIYFFGYWLWGEKDVHWHKPTAFLGSLFGCALYVCYPGSFISICIAVVSLLLITLIFSDYFSKQQPSRRVIEYWPWLVVVLILGLILISQGLVASLLERKDDATSFTNTLLLKKSSSNPQLSDVANPSTLATIIVDNLEATGSQIMRYLAGDKKYLCDFERFRRLPSLAWLLIGACILLITDRVKSFSSGVSILRAFIVPVLLLAFFTIFVVNIFDRSHIGIGHFVLFFMVLFGAITFRHIAIIQSYERPFWLFLLLLMFSSLFVTLLVSTASPGTLQEQYFMNPLEWGYNFLIAYAIVSCWETPAPSKLDKVLSYALWVLYTADFWNNYLMFFVIKNEPKLSWAVFYK